jgi:hypothetical protein
MIKGNDKKEEMIKRMGGMGGASSGQLGQHDRRRFMDDMRVVMCKGGGGKI